MDRVQMGTIALAVLLLVFWFTTLPESQSPEPGTPIAEPIERPREAPPIAPLVERGALPVPERADDQSRQEPVTRATLENDALRLVVSSLGGRLESIQLKAYPARLGAVEEPVELVTLPTRGTGLVLLGDGPFRGLESLSHERVSARSREVKLRLDRGGLQIERTISVDDSGYGGWIRVSVRNRSSQTLIPKIELVWYGAERSSDAGDHFVNYSLVALAGEGLERRVISGLGKPGMMQSFFGGGLWTGESYPPAVEWAGIESRYFLVGGVAENPADARAFLGPLGLNQGSASLLYPGIEIPPGRELKRSYRVYFGPKLVEAVAPVDVRLEPALQVGWAWIRPLVSLFQSLLTWIHTHLVSNYGIAIIILTIVLRILTFPLTQKSMTSMRRFSDLAPEMKKVQGKYKEDKTRLQQEMMALYKRKGVNPLTAMGGGCLPMLIQFPFLVGLYFALQGSIELRHAPFFAWINDLSTPETLLSIAGVPIRVLPLLMGGSMVLQQRLTPSAGGDPQQKQMMQWMSVMFVFLFYQFPSGLVLYWFVSNLLGIAQQHWVNRKPKGVEKEATPRGWWLRFRRVQ
ncbi:MAG: membrane protein insertase YidC [Myxococcota bacterium]